MAFDCSGRFGGTWLNDKVGQFKSCYVQGPDLTNRLVGVLSSFTKTHIRKRLWYVLSSPGARGPCGEISCASCVDLSEIWYQLYLWSIEKYDFPKLCQDEGLDWLVPKLYLSSCLVFCFFPNLSNFFIFFKFKGINLSLFPQGWGNCKHCRRHGWIFDESAGHNDRANCRFRKKKS